MPMRMALGIANTRTTVRTVRGPLARLDLRELDGIGPCPDRIIEPPIEANAAGYGAHTELRASRRGCPGGYRPAFALRCRRHRRQRDGGGRRENRHEKM